MCAVKSAISWGQCKAMFPLISACVHVVEIIPCMICVITSRISSRALLSILVGVLIIVIHLILQRTISYEYIILFYTHSLFSPYRIFIGKLLATFRDALIINELYLFIKIIYPIRSVNLGIRCKSLVEPDRVSNASSSTIAPELCFLFVCVSRHEIWMLFHILLVVCLWIIKTIVALLKLVSPYKYPHQSIGVHSK